MRKIRTKKFLLMLSVFCFFLGGFIYGFAELVIDRGRFVSQQRIQQINFNAYTGESNRVGLAKKGNNRLLIGKLNSSGKPRTTNESYSTSAVDSIIGSYNGSDIPHIGNSIVGGYQNKIMSYIHTGLENSVIVGGRVNHAHGQESGFWNGKNQVIIASSGVILYNNNRVVLGLGGAGGPYSQPEFWKDYGASFIGDRVKVYLGGSLTFGNNIKLGDGIVGEESEGHFVFNGDPGHQVEYGGDGTSPSMLIGGVEHGLVVGSGKILNNTGVKLSVDGAIGLGVGKCSADYAGSVYYLTGVTTNGGNIACLCACVGSGESVDSIALSNAPYCDSVCDNPSVPVNGKGQCGSRGKESPDVEIYEAGEKDWRPGSEFCADGAKPCLWVGGYTCNFDFEVDFPAKGFSIGWGCPGLTSADARAYCIAYRRSNPPECGVNAKSYYLNDTDYVGREEVDFCSGGAYSGVAVGEIEFPGYGGTVTWKCVEADVAGETSSHDPEVIECSAYHKDCNRCAKNGFPYCFDIDLDENCPTDPNETPGSGAILPSYKVIFNCAGGNSIIANQSFTVGSTGYLTEGACFKTGFALLGWNKSSSASTVQFPEGGSVYNLGSSGDNINLYAIWKKNSYTVKYNCNGGEGTMSDSVFTVGVPSVLKKNQCKKTGSSFLGWSMNSSATTVTYFDEQTVVDLGSTGSTVNLYAVWKPGGTYRVTYDCRFGYGSVPFSTFPVGGGGYLNSSKCTWGGHTFQGWSTVFAAYPPISTHYDDGAYFSSSSALSGSTMQLHAVWSGLSPDDECKYSCENADGKWIDGGCYEPSSCFIAGTRVKMSDGNDKAIEDVEIGDVVVGANGMNTVLGFHKPELNDKKLWSINGGGYFVTSEHPFMTTEGWKSLNPILSIQNLDFEVGLLKVGDVLVTENGYEIVESLSWVNDDKDTQLYNLLLDGDHTYYANGYLVHNKSVPSPTNCLPGKYYNGMCYSECAGIPGF